MEVSVCVSLVYIVPPERLRPVSSTLVAAHVLLSLATGEPPEVIRALKVDHIIATAAAEYDRAVDGMTPAARLAWLAERNLVEQYAITMSEKFGRLVPSVPY